LKNALAKAGLTMDDITAMEMGAENLTTAMLSGSLDACACWSPNSLKILEEMEGATKLADNVMFADNSVSLASWIVLDGYAAENGDNILAFTKALYKAMDYAADANYEEVAGYVANQTKTDQEGVYAQRGDADWLTGAEVAAGAADGTVENYYKVQQASFLASGAVTEEVPVADYVMLDNMIEAGK
ncbi:MAG: ABC transporter substrate-binding protein, partial [Firmicutes bacterium]|nr:ABC transporter substrate-binding protein [Bacillota bacterium]